MKLLLKRFYTTHVLSSSFSGNVAPGALARDIHHGTRSNALPNAPDDPTGPSAPVVVQPLDADRVGIDDDDVIYKLDDDNDASQPLKPPQFPSVLIDVETRFDVPVDKSPVAPLGHSVLTTNEQRRRFTSKRRRQLKQQPAIDNNHDNDHDHDHDSSANTSGLIVISPPPPSQRGFL